MNRVHTVGAAFSPCMRYVASGSEDRVREVVCGGARSHACLLTPSFRNYYTIHQCAYLFDIRSGSLVKRLTGAKDVVCDVAFNPRVNTTS